MPIEMTRPGPGESDGWMGNSRGEWWGGGEFQVVKLEFEGVMGCGLGFGKKNKQEMRMVPYKA